MNKKQISTKVAEITVINEISAIAKDVVINNKPSLNVKEVVINELQSTKKTVVQNVTAKTKTLAFRVALLQTECETSIGKAFLNAANLTKDDVNVPNVLKCFTSILVDGKPQFCRIIKLSNENAFTFEKAQIIDFKFSILDKNYTFTALDGKVILSKGVSKFTVSIIDTLNFNQVLSKLASYKKQAQTDAANKVLTDLKEKAKAEKELLNVKTPEQKLAEILKLKKQLEKLENVA